MEQIGKTALVFGPTGAVGMELLDLLLADHRYEKIIAFSRSVIPIEHPKLEVVLDSLTDLNRIAEKVHGDDLFCCLGTTIRKAGSKEIFRKVDLDMPSELARIASSNKLDGFIVISSIGAGKMGRGFYLDVKTEMENSVIQHAFKRLAIVRPSTLISKRNEIRIGEEFAKAANALLAWTLVGKYKKYRGISTREVARAMIEIINKEKPKIVWESDELANFN